MLAPPAAGPASRSTSAPVVFDLGGVVCRFRARGQARRSRAQRTVGMERVGVARFRLTEHPVLVDELATAIVGRMNKRALGATLPGGAEI
jgi:hypothetical protein